MKNLITILLTPSIWIQNYKYSHYCEQWCKEALKNPTIEIEDEYYAFFNGKKIWVENQPYALRFEEFYVRPSRSTILEIYKLVNPKLKGISKEEQYFKVQS